MNRIDAYWAALKKIQKQSSVALKAERLEDELIINGIRFKRATQADRINIGANSKGLLIRNLSQDEEEQFRKQGISFLTSRGKLFLQGENFQLSLEGKSRKKVVSRAKATDSLKGNLPSATALISPNGIEILDVLFRVAPEKLDSYKSALSFAHEYRLSQPKLSRMMRELRVKSIQDLKVRIKDLPDQWWERSLRYSMTRKRLVPFFEVEKIYRSLAEGQSQIDVRSNLEIWLGNKQDLLPGPVEVAKRFGLIRDSDIYLWATGPALAEVKRAFQLIPDRETQKTAWHIAVLPMGLEKGALLSPMSFTNEACLMSEIKTNLFRAIWDLGFGDERMREVQLAALRRVLDGV